MTSEPTCLVCYLIGDAHPTRVGARGVTPVSERHGVDATPDPHHQSTGEWVCYSCKRELVGTYLRPVLPWRHRPDKAPAQDKTEIAGLETTE